MHTLRRSCNACAKAKHACDLRTPRCYRCTKRNLTCSYANQPSAAQTSTMGRTVFGTHSKPDQHDSLTQISTTLGRRTDTRAIRLTSVDASFDPFDSYPETRLSRPHAQRLIYHCKRLSIHP